jgi:hypothetical protein
MIFLQKREYLFLFFRRGGWMRNVEQAQEQRKMNECGEGQSTEEGRPGAATVTQPFLDLNTLAPLWCPPTGPPLVLPTWHLHDDDESRLRGSIAYNDVTNSGKVAPAPRRPSLPPTKRDKLSLHP